MKIVVRMNITVFHDDKYSNAEKEIRQPSREIIATVTKNPPEWILENEVTHSGMTFLTFRKQDK